VKRREFLKASVLVASLPALVAACEARIEIKSGPVPATTPTTHRAGHIEWVVTQHPVRKQTIVYGSVLGFDGRHYEWGDHLGPWATKEEIEFSKNMGSIALQRARAARRVV